MIREGFIVVANTSENIVWNSEEIYLSESNACGNFQNGSDISNMGIYSRCIRSWEFRDYSRHVVPSGKPVFDPPVLHIAWYYIFIVHFEGVDKNKKKARFLTFILLSNSLRVKTAVSPCTSSMKHLTLSKCKPTSAELFRSSLKRLQCPCWSRRTILSNIIPLSLFQVNIIFFFHVYIT